MYCNKQNSLNPTGQEEEINSWVKTHGICDLYKQWATVPAYPSVPALRSMRRLTGIQEYDGWGKTDLHCTLRTSRQTATCIQICDVSCCAPVAGLGEQTNWLRSRLGVMLTGSSWDPASPGRTKRKMPVEREENNQKDREKHQFTVILLLITSFPFIGANKPLPSSLCPPSLPVQHWSSDFLPSSLILLYLHFIPLPSLFFPSIYSCYFPFLQFNFIPTCGCISCIWLLVSTSTRRDHSPVKACVPIWLRLFPPSSSSHVPCGIPLGTCSNPRPRQSTMSACS